MLGMVSGLITDNQITASSHTDRSWVPENARLLTSRTGWTLLPQPQPFTNEWLQVDLGEEKLVKGLIIQGGKHRENKVFMKKFRFGYSNNGSDWRMVMDTNGNKPRVRTFLCISFYWIVCYSTLEQCQHILTPNWLNTVAWSVTLSFKLWLLSPLGNVFFSCSLYCCAREALKEWVWRVPTVSKTTDEDALGVTWAGNARRCQKSLGSLLSSNKSEAWLFRKLSVKEMGWN